MRQVTRVTMAITAMLISFTWLVAPCAAQSSSLDSAYVAFAPPLDRSLTLKTTQADVTGDDSAPKIQVEIVRFRKAGSGFVMSWRREDTPTAELELDIDATGKPLGIRDWEQVQQVLLRSANAYVDASAAQGKYPTPALEEAVRRSLTGLYQDMTADTAPKNLMPNILMMLGRGGMRYQAGEVTKTQGERQSALGSTTFDVTQKTETVNDSLVAIRATMKMDPESSRKAIRSFAERGYAALPSEQAAQKRAIIERKMRDLDILVESSFRIDPKTGLVKRYEETSRTTMEGRTDVVTRSIELTE